MGGGGDFVFFFFTSVSVQVLRWQQCWGSGSIRMFLDLPDLNPLVRVMDPDPDCKTEDNVPAGKL